MRTHEAKLKAMASELQEHRATQLAKKARGKEAEEQRQKEAYLEFEVSSHPGTSCSIRACVPCTGSDIWLRAWLRVGLSG